MSVMGRKSYLSTRDIANLNQACVPIKEAFGDPPYLVGSSTETPHFRDVDVRSILPDAEFDELFGGGRLFLWSLFCWAVSEWLSKQTGLPVDYQVQRMTEANEKFKGPRNPMGVRARLFAGGGDATQVTA